MLKFLQGTLKKNIDFSKYNFINKMKVMLTWMLGLIFSRKIKLFMYEKVSTLWNEKSSNLVFMSNELYRFIDLKRSKDFFNKTTQIKFEKTDLVIPKNYHKLLIDFYGEDYMKPKKRELF